MIAIFYLKITNEKSHIRSWAASLSAELVQGSGSLTNNIYASRIKAMKKIFSPIVLFLGGMIACLLLPIEWQEQLSRRLAAVIGSIVGQMPDG